MKAWRPVLILLAVLAVPVIWLGRVRGPDDRFDEYRAALAESEPGGTAPFPPGGEAEQAAVGRFMALFADFRPEALRAGVAGVYAERFYFNDTLKTVRLREELADYMAASAAAAQSCTVAFVDRVAAGGEYYFRWEMTIRFRGLRGGRPTRTSGVTHVRFDGDGRVVFHQDYWDPAEGFFEHLPVLSPLLRAVKARI